MHLPQLRVGDVGVDLGRGDRGVAEHLLDGPDVGAVPEQLGREAVAQRMRRHVLHQAGRRRVLLDDPLDRTRREPEVAAIRVVLRFVGPGEQRLHRGLSFQQIGAQVLGSAVTQEDEPRLVALAAHHELASLGVHLVGVQRAELGNAEAGGVEELEDRAVAETRERVLSAGGLEQTLGLLRRQELDAAALGLTELDLVRGERLHVPLGEVLEQRPDRDHVIVLGEPAEFAA